MAKLTRLTLYPDTLRPGHCRTCRAAITWARLTSGSWHPFEGTVRPVHHQPSMLGGRAEMTVELSEQPSHFQFCPNAKTWRRRNPR
jgi:hypothetical protein